MTPLPGSLQHSVSWIGSELDRLERQTADVQTHVATLMQAVPSEGTAQTASGLQDLDRITQVLQNLAAFATALSRQIPIGMAADLDVLRDGLSLGELRARLDGVSAEPSEMKTSSDVDFF